MYRDIAQATNEGTKLNFKEMEDEIFKIPIKPI